MEKLPEDAQIKLSVVASDIFGVSGRAMLAALVEAFTGFFTDQHAFLLGKMLGRVDGLDADLAELTPGSRS